MKDQQWGMHEKPRARQHERYRREPALVRSYRLSFRVIAAVIVIVYAVSLTVTFGGWSP